MVSFAIYTTSGDVVYDSLKMSKFRDMTSIIDMNNVIIAFKKGVTEILIGLRTLGRFEGEPRKERLILFLKVNSIDEYQTALKEISEFMRTKVDRKVFLDISIDSIDLSSFDKCREEIMRYAQFIVEIAKREKSLKVKPPSCLKVELDERISNNDLDDHRIRLSIIGLYVLYPLLEYTSEWIFFSVSASNEPGIWFVDKGDELESFKAIFAIYVLKGDSKENVIDEYGVGEIISDRELNDILKRKTVLYIKKIEGNHYLVISIFEGLNKRRIGILVEFPNVKPIMDSIDVEFENAVEKALTRANIMVTLGRSGAYDSNMASARNTVLQILMGGRRNTYIKIPLPENTLHKILNDVAFKAMLLKDIIRSSIEGKIPYERIFIGLGENCPTGLFEGICIVFSKYSHIPRRETQIHRKTQKEEGFPWGVLFGGVLIGLLVGVVIASVFTIPIPFIKKTNLASIEYEVPREFFEKTQFLGVGDKDLTGAWKQFNKALLAMNGTISRDNITTFLNYTLDLLIIYDREYRKYRESYNKIMNNITFLKRENEKLKSENTKLNKENNELEKRIVQLNKTNNELKKELEEFKVTFGHIIEKNLTTEVNNLRITITNISEYLNDRKEYLRDLLSVYDNIKKKASLNLSLSVKYQAIVDRMNITVFKELYDQASSIYNESVELEAELSEISKLINHKDYIKAKKMLNEVKGDVKSLETRYKTFKQSFETIVKSEGRYNFKKWALEKDGDNLFKLIYEMINDPNLSEVFRQLNDSYSEEILKVNGKQVDPLDMLRYLIEALKIIKGENEHESS
ncbi:coiled-coil domain-containing protein [Pyrococcus abyssi]|nr:hypothetical protein [Pyrococcus abyssi]